MRVLKFEGATMRDAIARVKAELGDQAVIIATRNVRRGLLGSAVEISAAVDDDAGDPPLPAFAAAPPPPLAPRPDPDAELEKLIAPLRSELRSLRALVRTAGEPRGTSELRAEVVALRRLVEQLHRPALGTQPPAARTAPAATAATAPGATDGPLTAPSTAAAIMLVGPTGAGKTTTIAKLAAHAALVDGRRVGLITLDNYRVGGVAQIRTFAELIGVPVQVADSPAALADLIDPDHDLTLIDTAGRSPRDPGALDELARHAGPLPIEVHLVVPAATAGAHIDALVDRYRALGPARLLFTKLDEHGPAPELALAPVRAHLPITWVTTGQAVPEDIEQPTAARVRELAAAGYPTTRARDHRAA